MFLCCENFDDDRTGLPMMVFFCRAKTNDGNGAKLGAARFLRERRNLVSPLPEIELIL